MAHHSRVRGSGDAWASILPSELASLDALLRACVNGVDGGAYAPAGLITIGGSGLVCSGPLTVARGGTLVSSNGTLQFSPSIFPQLSATHSGRTRTVMYPFAAARPIPYSLWRPRRDSSGMQAVAPTYISWQNPTVVQPSSLSLPIRAENGGTIAQVTVNFRVGAPHTSIPGTLPAARLLRVDINGNAVPCTSVASGADSNGWVYVPKPSSGAAWFNLGAAQSFTLTCDQNNVVDVTQYTYRLEVIDEQGLSGWPWQVSLLQPVLAVLDASSTWPLAGTITTVDGVSLPSAGGARILVIKSLTGVNGIYISTSTSGTAGWQPSPDLSQTSQYSPGFVVGAQRGQNYGGTLWQASATQSSWSGNPPPPGTGVWRTSTPYALNTPILPLTPNGNWFLCTTGGTSGNPTEPAWPKAAGQTVVDNSVVWTCMGPYPLLAMVTQPDADALAPGLAMTHYGTIFESAAVTTTNLTTNGFR